MAKRSEAKRSLWVASLLMVVGLCGVGCPAPPDEEPEDRSGTPEPPMHVPGEPHRFADCPDNVCPRPEPALLYSGEFVERAVDLRVRGRGLDFVWARQYRSRFGRSTALGHGWDHGYDIVALRGPGDTVVLYDGFNRPVVHRRTGRGTYEADGYHRTLFVEDDGSVDVEFADGGRWMLRSLDDEIAPGHIDMISDRNGNTLSFAYDAHGRLIEIEDTLDRRYVLGYDEHGRIEALTDFTGRTVRYAYYGPDDRDGNSGDLASVELPAVTDADGTGTTQREIRYTYTTGFADARLNHNLLTITSPEGETWLRNRYAATEDPDALEFDRLVEQALGDADNRTKVAYESVDPAEGAVLRTWVNDAEGFVQEHLFDAANREVVLREHTRRADRTQPTDSTRNQPTETIRPDEPELYETRFTYNRDFHVVRVDRPNGSSTDFAYDDAPGTPASRRGRLLAQIDRTDAGERRQRTFSYEGHDLGSNHGGSEFATREVDFTGVELLHAYDERGNELFRSFPADATQREDWRYDAFGEVVLHVQGQDEHGRRQQTRFDYYGRDDGPANGYLAAIVDDPDGLALTTSFEYDARGNDIRRVDARGFDTLRLYDEADQIIVERNEDQNGFRRQNIRHYDANMHMVEVNYLNADPDGVVDPDNPTIDVFYDVDALGNNHATIAENTLASAGLPLFEVTQTIFDRRLEPVEVRFPPAVDGTRPAETIHWEWDARRLLLRETLARGTASQRVTTHDYDGIRQTTRTTVQAGGEPRVTTFAVDGWGRTTAEIDPMGNETVSTYDDADRLLSTLRTGELLDVPGSAGNVPLAETLYEYDDTGRPVVTRRRHFDLTTGTPVGDGWVVERATLDGRSRDFRHIDDLGGAMHRDFDTAGRLSGRSEPSGTQHAYEVNAVGYETARTSLLAEESGSALETRYEDVFDPALERISSVDERDAERHYTFDARGNPFAEFDARTGAAARGNTTLIDHDDLGRELRRRFTLTTDGTGGGAPVAEVVLDRVWDAGNRLLAEVDPNGNATRMTYDGQGMVLRIDYADGTFETMARDGMGNLLEHVDPNGTRLTMEYDLLDRLTLVRVDPGPGVDASTTFERYGYDGASNLVLAADDDSMVRRGYDSLGAMSFEVQQGRRTDLEHDGYGRIARMEYPLGRVVEYERDEAGRAQVIRDEESIVAELDYRGRTWVAARRYPAIDASSLFEQHGTGQLRSSEHAVAGVPFDVRQYVSDAEGFRNAELEVVAGSSSTSRHDSIGRITTTAQESAAGTSALGYTYDGAGNWLEVLGDPLAEDRPDVLCPGAYAVDAVRNAYTASPCEVFVYDPAGSLVRIDPRPDADGGRRRRLVYDHRHRAVEIRDQQGAATVRTRLRYDALGRLLRAQTTGPDADGRRVSVFTWAGEKILEERRLGPGGDRFTFVHTDERDAHVLERRSERTGERVFFFENDLGSTIATVALNEEGSTTLERVVYDEWGAPFFVDETGAVHDSSALGNDVLFTGLWRVPAHGLYYARTRWLDPRLGRFTAVDLAGRWADESAVGNGYTYAGNRPDSTVDRGGTFQTPIFLLDFSAAETTSIINENMNRVQSRAWRLRHQLEWVMDSWSNSRGRYYDAEPLLSDPLIS